MMLDPLGLKPERDKMTSQPPPPPPPSAPTSHMRDDDSRPRSKDSAAAMQSRYVTVRPCADVIQHTALGTGFTCIAPAPLARLKWLDSMLNLFFFDLNDNREASGRCTSTANDGIAIV